MGKWMVLVSGLHVFSGQPLPFNTPQTPLCSVGELGLFDTFAECQAAIDAPNTRANPEGQPRCVKLERKNPCE